MAAAARAVASAPTTKFTPEVVAALAGMSSPGSAANNVVGPMRRLGLLDKEGALTARGNKWRVDSSYAEACQEILDDVYPPDLAALTDDAGAPDLRIFARGSTTRASANRTPGRWRARTS